jgi:hypothetical protein
MPKRFKRRPRFFALLTVFVLPLVLFWGCTFNSPRTQLDVPHGPDVALATEIGKSIIAACPIADPGDGKARDQCADKLTKLDLLRNSMGKAVLWGGQKEVDNYKLKESNTTYFDPLVWRRMYLSTYMFSGEPRIEQKDDLTVIHLPSQFRDGLDAGSFPYPFWHSQKKWSSYKQSTEVLLMIKNGKIAGALRSSEKDPQRQVLKRKWDGLWNWKDKEGKQQPEVSLYKYLFAASNPHVEKLDATYRAFEGEMRQHSCLVCHSPSNANDSNPLLILSYPNQALTLRHETVSQIQKNVMPPPSGIADAEQKQKFFELAKAFAEVGDQAIAYEEAHLTAPAKPSS